MSICPVCNGFRDVFLMCTNCGEPMIESGRLMDYYDDYSPYMEIELLKREDGYPNTTSGQQCPHVFRCPQCHHDDLVFIIE